MFVSLINVFARYRMVSLQRTGSLRDLITTTVNLINKLDCLSLQNKIKIFQGDVVSKTLRYFPNARMITDAFSEEAIADHDVEDYKNKLQDDWWSSKTDLTICRI